MTLPKNHKVRNHLDRDSLNRAVEVADRMQEYEQLLIEMLYEIDRNRYYVLYGFNSLLGFCNRALKLSRTQSQRIVTSVRRHISSTQPIGSTQKIGDHQHVGNIRRAEPMVNFGIEGDRGKKSGREIGAFSH